MSIMASQKSHYDNDAQSQTLPAYCDGLGSNFCVFGDVDASKIVATWRSYADPLPGRRTLMQCHKRRNPALTEYSPLTLNSRILDSDKSCFGRRPCAAVLDHANLPLR